MATAVDFRGQAGRILLAPATDGHVERVLFGLGDKPSPLLFGSWAPACPKVITGWPAACGSFRRR